MQENANRGHVWHVFFCLAVAVTQVRFRFDRKAFPGKGFDEDQQVGFLAQEVEKEIPEVVKTDADGWKTVAYGNFAPYLVEAIKAQQKLIERLQARIAVLTSHEEELAQLRSGHAALSAEVAQLRGIVAQLTRSRGVQGE